MKAIINMPNAIGIRLERYRFIGKHLAEIISFSLPFDFATEFHFADFNIIPIVIWLNVTCINSL